MGESERGGEFGGEETEREEEGEGESNDKREKQQLCSMPTPEV